MVFFKLFLGIWMLGTACASATTDNKMTKPTMVIDASSSTTQEPLPGAYDMKAYLDKLKGKRVGMVVNQTSIIGKTHLVDSLLKLKINITKILTPEHGFRGDADAGEKVKSISDEATGIMMVSIYGDHRKPTADDLKDLDIIIFDVQDIGVRFYTYIATMTLVMEACAEHHIPLIVLDRPNPNGYYVDGPVMKKEYQSFLGMHPVPVVYGLSIGEYARMVNGEGWLANKIKCNLTVIPCKKYDHAMTYNLPIKPSPNIPNLKATLLYPSTCFFEGTMVNEGRGTDLQFQCFGHPLYTNGDYTYTPVSKVGAKSPKLMGQICKGYNLSNLSIQEIMSWKKLNFKWMLLMYENLKSKENFFPTNPAVYTPFNKLAGNADLMEQIKSGKTEDQIRSSWQADLKVYKLMRKKYLLYKDFE